MHPVLTDQSRAFFYLPLKKNCNFVHDEHHK